MGTESELFCRQTLVLLTQNLHVLPRGLNLIKAQRNLTSLDILRSCTNCLSQFSDKTEGAEVSLGSGVINAALEGHFEIETTSLMRLVECIDWSASPLAKRLRVLMLPRCRTPMISSRLIATLQSSR